MIESTDLVALAMKRLGCAGYTDLAKKLGYGVHSDKRIERWGKGTSQPNYEGTMRLLEAIGALRLSEAAPARLGPHVPAEVAAEALDLLRDVTALLGEAHPRAPATRRRSQRQGGGPP